MQQVISVWVRDPRIQKNDFWHAYMDYEISLHANSVCFTKKVSRVRRRYSEFVWLRQKLQENSLLVVPLPGLPPKNPFFSLNNGRQIAERMKGLQTFLEQILQSPLWLSDSCLHLFLQSQLSVAKMEACASGRTHYSVAQAVQSCACALRRFHSEQDLNTDQGASFDSDCSLFRGTETRRKDTVVNCPETTTTTTTTPLDIRRVDSREDLSSSSISP